MSEEPDWEMIADGLALFQEHAPQSGEDWIGVSDRCLASGEDGSRGSPLFHALMLRTDEAYALAADLAHTQQRARELGLALQRIVDFPIHEQKSAGWHFAEVRADARAALSVVSAGTDDCQHEWRMGNERVSCRKCKASPPDDALIVYDASAGTGTGTETGT